MQSRRASASSSGFPENYDLKCDQLFKCTICCAGHCGACGTAGSAVGGGGLGAETSCGCGPGSAISYLYSVYIIF